MKALILLFLFAMTAEAQNLADIARAERQRQALVQSRQTFTNDNLNSAEARLTETTRATEPAPAGSAAAPQAAPAAAEQRFRDELERARARVRELQDQETALQLQVNQLTNQLFAPVTDQAMRDQAQMRIGDVQTRLTALRGELQLSQRILADLITQGSPRN
jgi:hypothetical protein